MNSNNIYDFAENGYYFQRTDGRQLSAKLHSHNFYEFLYIVSGECVHELDGFSKKLVKGEVVFITPGISHRFLSQSADCDVIALSVVSSEMSIFFDMYNMKEFPDKSFALKLSIEKYRILLEKCESVTFDNKYEYILQLRMVLNQIFLFGTEFKRKNLAVPPEFAKIIEKMNTIESVSEGISAFLRLSGYSHSQLCRLTKKYIGMTPTEYINQIRMNYAYDMIVYGNEDYETICETVGFESFSYFCKMLKKHFGCSAAKLRKSTAIMRDTL